MYKIVYTNRMKKDAKLIKKWGKDMQKLVNVLSLLATHDQGNVKLRGKAGKFLRPVIDQ